MYTTFHLDWTLRAADLGNSAICNGNVTFGDTGAVLPDGQIQEPRRAGRAAA
ncbi:DUF5999 family protein [Streptomyces albidoflavus]|uniref:DUF5999 family protein n=1 Tax=Streptomyces albidoflavus TaxID=1886 RepID=UPI0013EE9D25|nr:DUF5999 family protein [Streptomyces albidoflavus]